MTSVLIGSWTQFDHILGDWWSNLRGHSDSFGINLCSTIETQSEFESKSSFWESPSPTKHVGFEPEGDGSQVGVSCVRSLQHRDEQELT